AVDPLHVSIDVGGSGRDGYAVQRGLRERGVFIELTSPRVLLAILGMGETEAEGLRLVRALRAAIARAPDAGAIGERTPAPAAGPVASSPREAFLSRSEQVPIHAAVGRVCAETVAVFPPGIPNALPGERITAGLVDFLEDAVRAGAVVLGCADAHGRTL